jgi:hypothetical protein
MEPLAVAAYTMIAGASVLAFFLGALGGATAWLFKLRLIWGGLGAATYYFTETVVRGLFAIHAAAFIGLPPLILTLLVSWLAARYLEGRTKLHRVWVALMALVFALLIGCLVLFAARFHIFAPVYVALAADSLLVIAFLYRTWKTSHQHRIEG